MSEFKAVIGKLASGATLSFAESANAFDQITSGVATPAQLGAFLMALRVRGETVEELAGAATTLREKMVRVSAPPDAMDVVGTGGDESCSYNVSTCAALIVAGAGGRVAKHGNRALSSRCGASDVLTSLGVNVGVAPEVIGECIAEAGIGFMFAPNHHPALRHVASARLEMATRTVFNLLGPLLNPAGVRRHLVGVFARGWVEPIAEVLGRLGSERAYVVYGSDGLDEITTTGPTTIAELNNGRVDTFEVTPEDVGLKTVRPEQLRGADPAHNAAALRAVLEGAGGPYRDIAIFNAAAALAVAGRAQSLRDGVELAATAIDSGAALARLDQLIALTNRAP